MDRAIRAGRCVRFGGVGAQVMGTSDLTKDLRAKHTPDRHPLLTSLQLTLLAARVAPLAQAAPLAPPAPAPRPPIPAAPLHHCYSPPPRRGKCRRAAPPARSPRNRGPCPRTLWDARTGKTALHRPPLALSLSPSRARIHARTRARTHTRTHARTPARTHARPHTLTHARTPARPPGHPRRRTGCRAWTIQTLQAFPQLLKLRISNTPRAQAHGLSCLDGVHLALS